MLTTPRSWALRFHDEVVEWLRPYSRLYAKRGFDLDDIVQEARLALVEQQDYLDAAHKRTAGSLEGLCKKIVLRSVKRRLLGRTKPENTPRFTPEGWEAIHAAEDDSYIALMQVELTDMILAAPNGPIKMYLRSLLTGHGDEQPGLNDPTIEDLHAKAAAFVLEWFLQYHWRHES